MSALTGHLLDVFASADERREPFRHWLLTQVLPPHLARAVPALPFAPLEIGDTFGKRETNNATRVFFSAENRDEHKVCDEIADAFQSPQIVAALSHRTGADLSGASLRIEYCQDRAGFWLEPHTDIGAKRFTMLVYLSDHPDADDWGTDVYDGEKRHVGRAPAGFNRGLIFIPGSDTWHGVEKRNIAGIRRSLIINYVGPEWRARQELAYPDLLAGQSRP